MLHDIEQLNERIDESVNTNGQRAISGVILNRTLKDIAETLGQGRSYAGTINPSSAEPDHNDSVFYFATGKGTYFQQTELPLEIERDGIYVVYWDFYIGKWMSRLLAYDTAHLAVLSAQERAGRYIGDTNHELLSDTHKIRAVRIAPGRILYFSSFTPTDDVYDSLPSYDSETATIKYYSIYVSKTRNDEIGGYPYVQKELTISGVTERDQ